MKKTYINPQMEIVKLKINQHLLDSSPQVDTGSTPTPPEDSDTRWDEGLDW